MVNNAKPNCFETENACAENIVHKFVDLSVYQVKQTHFWPVIVNFDQIEATKLLS